MATATIPPAAKLSYEQFREQFERGDKSYEYWYGEAVPKGMPTLIHGFLQMIIMMLLHEAGFHAASEVELRIEAGARPKPDVIAGKTITKERYPTKAWDVVVEILSEDDSFMVLRGKCKKYQEWGFGKIYLVDPTDRSVAEWKEGIIAPCSELASIPVQRIWDALDQEYAAAE
jgi:Uma2 family endonuclease